MTAVVLLTALAACSGDAEAPAGRTTTTAEPSPLSTEPLFLEDRERPKIAAALERFMAAFEADRWTEVVSWIDADGRAYLRGLTKIVPTAGPRRIRQLDAHGRTTVAVLRTVRDPEEVPESSLAELVETMAQYGLLGTDGRFELEYRPRDIQPLGDKAFLRIVLSRRTGAAVDVDFALEDGVWKLDISDMTRLGGMAIEALAAKREIELERLILLTASVMTGVRVKSSVWEKPTVDA